MANNITISKLLSPTSAGMIVGVHYSTILREMKAGRLRYKKIGKDYRTTERWLNDWIEKPEQMPVITRENEEEAKKDRRFYSKKGTITREGLIAKCHGMIREKLIIDN